ncbi:MAG: methyltransferase domain-containing protein [Actinomycetota bacterium]|nr:methyltransferase domain-containing protein [Actinomycetota bacterium]
MTGSPGTPETGPDGGYESGYRACSCFWGTTPGSYVSLLTETRDLSGCIALDAGCGEGKNAAHLANGGATVDAWDISERAIQNGKALWGNVPSIRWRSCDIRATEIRERYGVVVAYGLLHCFRSETEVRDVLDRLQRATHIGGYNVLCCFNSRCHDLNGAHPSFAPLLLPHDYYASYYATWDILAVSDSDLAEVHPHEGIDHVHSLTRVLAQRQR